jgi:hypothetical protein
MALDPGDHVVLATDGIRSPFPQHVDPNLPRRRSPTKSSGTVAERPMMPLCSSRASREPHRQPTHADPSAQHLDRGGPRPPAR